MKIWNKQANQMHTNPRQQLQEIKKKSLAPAALMFDDDQAHDQIMDAKICNHDHQFEQ